MLLFASVTLNKHFFKTKCYKSSEKVLKMQTLNWQRLSIGLTRPYIDPSVHLSSCILLCCLQFSANSLFKQITRQQKQKLMK